MPKKNLRDMKIRLNEAIAFARKNGMKIRKVDFAQMLWKKSSAKTAHTNYSNLAGGKNKKIDIEAVPMICQTLGVSADFLFGLTDEPTKKGEIAIAIENSPQGAATKVLKNILPELEEVCDTLKQL